MKKIGTFILKVSLIFCITLGASFFAFEKIYENLKKPEMQIVLVNEDKGTYFQTQTLSFGNSFVKQIERDSRYSWTVAARGVAENRLASNSADLMVVIPSDFSKKAVAINDTSPEQLSLIYKINPMSTFLQSTQAESILTELEKNFNKSITEVYFASALQSIDNTKLNVNRIVEEEKAHEAIVVHEINANVTKMTENFTTVKLNSENDTSRLEGLVSSLESFNERNIRNTEYIGNYQGDYKAFEAVYLNNNNALSAFTGQSLNFNAVLQDGNHQTNIGNMSASMAALQNYLNGDSGQSTAVLRLEEAKNQVTDSIGVLKENRNVLDQWLGTGGDLDKEVEAVQLKIEETKSFPNSNARAKEIIEKEIKELCETKNVLHVGSIAKEANSACEKLGYKGKAEYTSSFKGISYFAVDAKDPATIELSVPESAIIEFDACSTVDTYLNNFVAKDGSTVKAIGCDDVEIVANTTPNQLQIKPNVEPENQQLFAIQYTVTAPEGIPTIEVSQQLQVEILPAEKPVVYVPDTGNDVTVKGRGILDAKIKIGHQRIVDSVVEEIGTYETDVRDDGSWEYEVEQLLEGDELIVHQEVGTQADDVYFYNPSETVTVFASQNPAPTVQRIKTGKNSYIKGTGTAAIPGTTTPTVHVTLSNGTIITTTTDAVGNWLIIAPEELELGQVIEVVQKHDINGTLKTSPVIIKTVVDTIPPTPNPIEAGFGARISGNGEPDATIEIYLKEVASDGTVTLSAIPIAITTVAKPEEPNEENEIMSGIWEVVLPNDIKLKHNEKLQIVQTDIYGKPAGEYEVIVTDTIAPDLPTVIEAVGDKISGTGEPGAKLILTVNEVPFGIDPIDIDDDGNWSVSLTENLVAEDEVHVFQKDIAGNSSDSVEITIGSEVYQNVLTVDALRINEQKVVKGTGMPNAKITVFFNDPLGNLPFETDVAADGTWEIQLQPEGEFVRDDTITVRQTIKILEETTTNNEDSTTNIEDSTTIVPINRYPSIVTYNMTVRKESLSSVFSTFSASSDTKHYNTTKKATTLDNQNESIVETTPAVIDSYFQLYYGLTIETINNNADIHTKEDVEAIAMTNGSETLYGLLKTEHDPIEAITTALAGVKDKINTSFTEMRTQTQTAIDTLDGNNCVDNICSGGIDEMLETEIANIREQSSNLAGLQQNYAGFQETFTNIQTQSNDVATTLNTFTVDKAEEAPLLFEVTDQHVKMLEQAVSLQENAKNYHESATGMKESAANFADKTSSMTAESLTYLQGLQQSTITLQENVENNSVFSENLLTVFANSQINGIENNNLYDFMSNPVKKENYSAASYAGMTLFPYFTMIICFILSLMMAYSFLNWKRKIEMVYADEYVGDVLKANVQKAAILSVIATIVAIIVGVTSAFMAELLGWQLLVWVVTLVFIINALTHLMYYLLKQFKSVGLFIILGILLVYLLSSQTLGVYISEGTFLAKMLSLFPLVYLEKFLFAILYGASLAGTSSTVIGVFVAVIFGIGLSLTTGLLEAKKAAAAETKPIRSK